MAEIVEAGSLFRGDGERIQLISFLRTEQCHVTFEMFVPVCGTNGCKLELHNGMRHNSRICECFAQPSRLLLIPSLHHLVSAL